jgi:hypothetical protein
MPALVFMDCEGCEREILDPEKVPYLARADVIVELHELGDDIDTTALVTGRFEETHDIEILDPMPRDPADNPPLKGLSEEDQHLALEEPRPAPTRWAVMVAKAQQRPNLTKETR